MITPVILSGGVGSRMWPLSRSMYPKQLLSLIGSKTMLQQTAQRLPQTNPIIVVCAEAHRFMVKEQLEKINVHDTKIILEPVGRNTAPAIALAAWQSLREQDDATLLIMPADHLIRDNKQFLEKIALAEKDANQGYLVTFGIKPEYPEIGYGYIKLGKPISNEGYQVEKFVEKPDLTTAEQYQASGDYYWNSGLFLFKASVFLNELEKHNSEIYHQTKLAYSSPKLDGAFVRPDKEAFAACPEDSIDYAVMERTKMAAIIPTDMGWSDIGSWDSLWANSPKDQDNNTIVGDVLTEQTQDCYIHSEHRLVTAVGVKDLVIVETSDALLVAEKSTVQNVKNIVDQLKSDNRPEVQLHRKVYRPWGSYEGIDIDDKFQVKRISINPGAQLSLQKHAFRAEHWVVVRGIATITRDDEVFDIKENESTYIPLGSVHRLENKQSEIVELIEIQTGTYFGEDDIERLDDIYGRKEQD